MLTLGEFKEIYGDNSLPSIYEYVSKREVQDKNKIINYLKKGKIIACAAGKAVDVFTGDIIFGELTFMSDGIYEWRSDLAHYVDKYNLLLPDDFIKHVKNK